MTTKEGKTRWPLELARTRAEELVRILEPACQTITIAGSIRRQKPDVGDIEILAIPRFEERPVDLFGETQKADCLTEAINSLIYRGYLACRLNKNGSKVFGPLNKHLIDTTSRIPLDIFAADAKNWGMSLLVRTGSAEFNIQVMSRFHQLGLRGHAYGGVSDAKGKEIACPTEDVVFRLLQWDYIEPVNRKALSVEDKIRLARQFE